MYIHQSFLLNNTFHSHHVFMAFVFMAHFVLITKTLRNSEQNAFLRLFILAQYKSI